MKVENEKCSAQRAAEHSRIEALHGSPLIFPKCKKNFYWIAEVYKYRQYALEVGKRNGFVSRPIVNMMWKCELEGKLNLNEENTAAKSHLPGGKPAVTEEDRFLKKLCLGPMPKSAKEEKLSTAIDQVNGCDAKAYWEERARFAAKIGIDLNIQATNYHSGFIDKIFTAANAALQEQLLAEASAKNAEQGSADVLLGKAQDVVSISSALEMIAFDDSKNYTPFDGYEDCDDVDEVDKMG